LNILTHRQQQFLLKNVNLDFSYHVDHRGYSVRSRDMYFDLDHLALNMRRINNRIWPFKDLVSIPVS